MAKSQTPAVTADGRSGEITLYNRPRGGGASLKKTIFITGTFGSGTATLQISDDGGTDYVDVLDNVGAAVTFTANKAVNVEIASDAVDPVLLTFNLAGATSPNLVMTVYDAS